MNSDANLCHWAAAIVTGLADYEVIIPAYDAQDTLAEAIVSVQRQTHPPKRIWVVDDGSRDNTAGIARGFAGVELIQQQNGGSGAATNAGLLRFTAGFVAFLDADDLWLPGKAEAQIRYLLENPDVAGTFTRASVFRGPADAPNFVRDLDLWTRSTMLLRASVAKQIGLMLTDLPGGMGEFVDWTARGRDLGFAFELLPEVMAWRRIRKGSQSYEMDEAKTRGYLLAARRALERRRAPSLEKSADQDPDAL